MQGVSAVIGAVSDLGKLKSDRIGGICRKNNSIRHFRSCGAATNAMARHFCRERPAFGETASMLRIALLLVGRLGEEANIDANRLETKEV
jgi:hypothetical protein